MDKRQKIIDLTKEYYQEHFSKKIFIPGETYINYSGKVFDEEEMINLVESSLDFWLTTGKYASEFESKLSKFIQVKDALLTNSGSSANLLAMSAITSPSLKERQVKEKDEVITIAAGFPTTINPIFQNNLIPVFCDIELGTYNIEVSQLEEALSSKTKAIILAHTLGNPFNLDKVKSFVEKHNLWLIEDNCDALGSMWGDKLTGSFGDMATQSFYPPHHITMGEGGAVLTNRKRLKRIIESFRDWGRDCWCPSGKDNTCGKRFDWKLGTLPSGYDHKYIYSHIGYNLKVTDMQAAIGVAQLKKLPDFIKKRQENFKFFLNFFKSYEHFFHLPKSEKKAKPSWFGFFLMVNEKAPFSRNEIVNYLEENKIATRMLFAGNITRHPAYKNKSYRCVSDLKNSDLMMRCGFWIGVYPGIFSKHLEYITKTFSTFLSKF